ncbi:MAG: glycosyl transferase, group 1 [Candidatus Eremiobacteraeota bacterium]|nr:glycosyl transferase, group 1 [Candidatus Eremiobacteraeota bacterium]
MRVALVSEHASPLATLGGVDAGGQNVHVAALAAEAAKLGHHVTVYTRRDDATTPRRVVMAPGVVVEHVDAGPPRSIPKDAIYPHVGRFASRLRRAWALDRPDVVHSHFWMSGLAALQAATPLAIPTVHTFHALGAEKRRHQGGADTSPAERIAREEEIARGVDRIVATSSAEVFELMRMGANPRSIKIVPCGVDVALFTPDGPREPRRDDRLRIVALSRLVPRKGIADVVEALAEVPGAELVIAGGGESPELVTDPEARRLSELARRLGLDDRVSLRGRIERAGVPALLRSADVVVCAPWYEPFGIVPLEAMACGTPVVVTSVGGLVDTVADGITGLHVPARSPRMLAAALNALRTDETLRLRLGRQGADRVRGRYSWLRIAAETIEVYNRLLRSRVPAEASALGG